MHLKHRLLVIITALVSILLILAMCGSGAAAMNQSDVKLTVYEVNISVDEAIAEIGYQVYSDEEPREVHHDRTYQSLVVSQYDSHGVELGASEQVLLINMPESWTLHATATAGTVTVEQNRVIVEGIKGNITLQLWVDTDTYVVHLDDYAYGDAASVTPTIYPELPTGATVEYYYSYTSNGTLKIPWSTENGNNLGVGTYYIFAKVFGEETARSAFHVLKASGIMPGVPTVSVENMPVMVTLNATDIGRDLQYSIDGGATWITLYSAEEDAGFFSVPGLQRSTEYTLLLKASATENFTESEARSITFTTADLTPVYKIKYHANGGMNTPDDISVKEGELYTIDSGDSVYKYGYVFDGWYTEATGGTKVSGTRIIQQNLDLYAHWRICGFTVFFDSNGGTGSMQSISAYAETPVTLPPCTFGAPADTAYFGGWAVTPDANPVYADQQTLYLVPDAEDGQGNQYLTLYAVWVDGRTNTIEVSGIDGTEVQITVMYGNLQVSQSSWYTISGGTVSWPFVSADGFYNAVVKTTNGIIVTKMISVNGSGSVYTVDLPEAGANSEVVVEANTPQAVAGNLETEAEANREAGKSITIFLTVEAQVEEENASDTVQNDIQDIARVAVENESTSLEYLTLDVTKKATSGTGTTEQRITVTDTVLEIVVPFDCTGKEDITVYRKHSDGVEILTQIYARPASGTDGTYYVDTANNLVYIYSQKFSLYSIGWSVPGVVMHTITYDANGGTGTMDPVTVADEGWIVLPSCGFTAPAEKEFECWMVNGVFTYPGDTLTPTGDVTVYAVWKPLGTWKVSFHANGGTGTMDPEYVTKGESMRLPSCGFAAPSGMKFSSWRIGSTLYEAGALYTPASDVTAYAVWKSAGTGGNVVSMCLVQFETFDATEIEDQYLKEGSLVREPVQPAEAGWVFAGWYTEDGNQWDFAQDRVYYSMTLYAKWEPAEDRPPVTPDEPVTPVATPFGVAGVLAGLIGAGAVMMRRKGKI